MTQPADKDERAKPRLQEGQPCPDCGKVVRYPLSHVCGVKTRSTVPECGTRTEATNIDRTWWRNQGADACIDRMILIMERAEKAERELAEARRTIADFTCSPDYKTVSASGAWIEVEKAKADAYEAAALIVEEMSYPPEGQERWHGTDNEWAAIKLEDAAKAIRERKAKVCHVTQAAPVSTTQQFQRCASCYSPAECGTENRCHQFWRLQEAVAPVSASGARSDV